MLLFDKMENKDRTFLSWNWQSNSQLFDNVLNLSHFLSLEINQLIIDNLTWLSARWKQISLNTKMIPFIKFCLKCLLSQSVISVVRSLTSQLIKNSDISEGIRLSLWEIKICNSYIYFKKDEIRRPLARKSRKNETSDVDESKQPLRVTRYTRLYLFRRL